MCTRQNVNSSKVPLQFRSITVKSQLYKGLTLYRNCGTAGTAEIKKRNRRMCKRKTKLMTIYFINNKGMFKSFDEIKKVADSLKAKFEYMRKNNKDYFVNAFIGISQLDIRHGFYEYESNGKPGRNKLVRVPKRHKNAEKLLHQPWHLHILIEANPGETICEQVVDYFNKKFKRNIAHKRPINKGFFPYVMKQSGFIRYVVEDRPTDLVKYNFKIMYEQNYKPPTKTGKKFRKFSGNILRITNNRWKENETAGLHTIKYGISK